MSYIWLMGGGIAQLPMAQEIRARGYELFITDADEHCACADLATNLVSLSTYDIANHVTFAKTLVNNKPIAVLTDAADVGPTVSAVAQALGLPACSYQTACNTRNKAEFRRITYSVQEHPVFACVSKDVYCSEAWLAWLRQATQANLNPFKVVIKPSDNCASRGVGVVTNVWNLKEFEHGWQKAVDNNSRGQEIVLEECLSGQEYTTDWFVTKDTVHYVSSAKRFFHSFGIESSHVSPAWPNLTVPHEVQRLAEIVTHKLGILGPFKLDFLYDERYGWCVMEAATRWTGGFEGGIGSLQATGRNLKKSLLDFALGLPLDTQDFAPKWYKYSAMYAPLVKVSKLTSGLLVKVSAMPYVYEVVQTRTVDKLVTCGADRGVFILTVADEQGVALDSATEAGIWLKQKTS